MEHRVCVRLVLHTKEDGEEGYLFERHSNGGGGMCELATRYHKWENVSLRAEVALIEIMQMLRLGLMTKFHT